MGIIALKEKKMEENEKLTPSNVLEESISGTSEVNQEKNNEAGEKLSQKEEQKTSESANIKKIEQAPPSLDPVALRTPRTQVIVYRAYVIAS